MTDEQARVREERVFAVGDRVRLIAMGRNVVERQRVRERAGSVRSVTGTGCVYVRWDGLKSDQGWYPLYLEFVPARATNVRPDGRRP